MPCVATRNFEAIGFADGRFVEPFSRLTYVLIGIVHRVQNAVGTDFETWTGMCGKQGQSVPVSSGQPTVLVREMTVGGTAA